VMRAPSSAMDRRSANASARDACIALRSNRSHRARHGAEPSHHFFDVRARVERADAEVAFAAATEAGARRGHHARLAQEPLEERPAVASIGHLAPDVRRVVATPGLPAKLSATLEEDARVSHVEVDERGDLALTFGGVERLGAALDGVAHVVRARVPPPRPQRVQRDSLTGAGVRVERFRQHGVAAADAGETTRLREAAELDRALARAGNLVDRLRCAAAVEALVCGIPEDDRAVPERVGDPRLDERAFHHGAGRIVG